jgi:hypothetical protein
LAKGQLLNVPIEGGFVQAEVIKVTKLGSRPTNYLV